MRHWSQLGIRNWRVKPGRTAGAIGAIALGVGVVIWVTCAYESVRLALKDQTWFWIGKSHLSVESGFGTVGTVFHSLEEELRHIPNVRHVTSRLRQQMQLHPLQKNGNPMQVTDPVGETVEAFGIDPKTEYDFRDYAADRMAPNSRLIRPDDTDAAVIEEQFARRLDLKIGDRFLLRSLPPLGSQAKEKTAVFTIVGLIEHRRVAKQQLPVVIARLDRVQTLAQFMDDIPRVTKIDLILENTTPKAILNAKRAIRRLVDSKRQGFLLTSAEGKIRQVELAERQSGFVLILLSSVALFTGFFIILSTLSMGMVERVGQLGALRCLGATRFQIMTLVLSEALPIGLLGMLLGIPIGLGLARLSVLLAPEYIGQVVISHNGMLLAMGGGFITTLAGATLPALQAMRVSPLAASRPQASPPPAALTWIAAGLGTAMIIGQWAMIKYVPPPRWISHASTGVINVALLYGGYALITPLLIRIIGQLALFATARILRVRRELLSDQVGRAVWRSASISCGLMVGLSLIVSLLVYSKSIASGWNFPRDFAEAFVYLPRPIKHAEAQRIRDEVKGIGRSALINESLRCAISGGGWFFFNNVLFVAGEPEEFFNIANLEFVEGDKTDAIAKLKKGGYILVTPEFSRVQKLGYGDKVLAKPKDGRTGYQPFEIAGIVTSPALDIAANYFNAGGMLIQASVHVVLGTRQDVHRCFRVPDVTSLFLLNFDVSITDAGIPDEFRQNTPPPLQDPARAIAMMRPWKTMMPERAAELEQADEQWQAQNATGNEPVGWSGLPMLSLFCEALLNSAGEEWSDLKPEQRWQRFREELVMKLLAARGGGAGSHYASVRALKDQINRDLHRATLLLASVPMVALIVAALGVANLMMANVTSRTRQIAMLRAVGATKWQIGRLVVGEALVLGFMGTLIGVVLGMHAAKGLNAITEMIWGIRPEFAVDWQWVGIGIAFTLGVCLIAGILPARYASRNNIIDALQTT